MSKASDLARLVTSGSTAIHGEAGVTSSGSTGATTNLQQGLCKARGNIDGDASTPASRDSYNVGSITDVSAGQLNYAITSAMSDGDYARTVSAGDSGNRRVADTGAAASNTSVLGIIITEDFSGSLADVDDANGVVHGDLA